MSTEPFKTRLQVVSSSMEAVLDELLPPISGRQSIICEAMRYAVLGGGKRLRPFLLIETAQLFAPLRAEIWQVAAAIECLHVYSLVHDDLPSMDNDDLRRGKPTVHKQYDTAIATLTGDALLTLAFQIISMLKTLDAKQRIILIEKLSQAGGVRGMIGGQVMDMYSETYPQDEALITELQALKTGALIRYSVETGAILGGANPQEIQALIHFANDLGLVFQIRDDILDEEGAAAQLGKAVGKDKNLGKATFVSIDGLKGAKDKAKFFADRAKGHLDPFEEKAHMLRETVDFALWRNH